MLRALGWALLVVAVARGGFLLARAPCRGIADNLDAWRVARPAGVEVEPQRRQGYFVVCSYAETAPELARSFSSAALVAWAARGLDWGLDVPAGRFDLRQLGLLYGAMAGGVLLAAAAGGLPVPLAVLLAWVLLDPGFLLFFNSFYADAAMIAAVLAVVCALPVARWGERRERAGQPSWAALVTLLAAAFLGAFSKMQYAPFALVLLVALGVGLLARRERPHRREVALLALVVPVAVAAPLHFLYGPAPRFLDANAYNAVYGGIARVATDPPAALARLGIPPEHRHRSTKDYFAARVAADDPVLPHLRGLSRLRLAGLYLADPPALGRAVRVAGEHLWRLRTHPRGMYVEEESRGRPRALRTPEQYGAHRLRLLGLLPPVAWPVLVVALLAALVWRAVRQRWDGLATAELFLLGWFLAQGALGVLGEGFVNLHQHLLGSRLALDLGLAIFLARLLARAGTTLGAATASPRATSAE